MNRGLLILFFAFFGAAVSLVFAGQQQGAAPSPHQQLLLKDFRPRSELKVAEQTAHYQHMTPAQLGKIITEMEKRMIHHAEMLEFEEAADMRDQIKELRESVLR